jgi:NAD(P)-dependent dehydrogenase (short-subunit alcohol dehydrogenase family)
MIDLRGHAALITGGTQGVGRAIALAMARAGADLALHGLRHRRCGDGDSAALSGGWGARVELLEGDLAGPTEPAVERLFEQAREDLPRIDILVNNAGSYFEAGQSFLELDYDTFERTMRLNVFAYFFLTQRFARYWVESTRGGPGSADRFDQWSAGRADACGLRHVEGGRRDDGQVALRVAGSPSYPRQRPRSRTVLYAADRAGTR